MCVCVCVCVCVVCVRERLFASLSKWIMFMVIPAPWDFDQSEDSLLAHDLY